MYYGEDDVYSFLVGSIEEKRDGVDVVSPTSPLGKALLDQTAGTTVEYEAPGGKLRVEIVRLGD
jgi:transcription elongation factor GreA